MADESFTHGTLIEWSKDLQFVAARRTEASPEFGHPNG